MYATSECQAWYNAKDTIHAPPQAQTVEETQALSLDNICMVDGSWTATNQFSGIGWVWKDSMGRIQILWTRNLQRGRLTTLGTGSGKMGNGEHATVFDLSEIWDRLQNLIAMVVDPQVGQIYQLSWKSSKYSTCVFRNLGSSISQGRKIEFLIR